ncbi:MAG: hypothetical protein AAGJ50_15995, partial [Pseudomonadota bacterium]
PKGASMLTVQIDSRDEFKDGTTTAMERALNRFFRHTLWTMLAWDEQCQNALANTRSFALSSPGRQWPAEMANTCATDIGRPSVTVQNALLFKGYTYTRPTGSIITAIDTHQRDVLVDGFGVPKESVLVCGSPRFDTISRSATQRTVQSNMADHPVALFATQPGIEDVAVRVLCTLSERVLPANSGLRVRVKMHPRSTAADITKLRSTIEDLTSARNFELLESGDIDTLIDECDLVLTAYSNVGLEAAIRGKPVIFTPLDTGMAPLCTPGLGEIAQSDDAVADLVSSLLQDEAFRHAHATAQHLFFDANPHLRDGTSTAEIKRAIDAALASVNAFDT